MTPLFAATTHGHTEVVSIMLAANASVDKENDTHQRHRRRLLPRLPEMLSFFLRRRPRLLFEAPFDTASTAAERGHDHVVAWLVKSKHWSTAPTTSRS